MNFHFDPAHMRLPSPRYSQSPIINAIVHQIALDKIGSKPAVEKSAEPVALQGVAPQSPEPCVVGDNTPLTSPSASTQLTPIPRNRPSLSRKLQATVERMPDPYAKRWRRLWKHEKLAVSFEAADRRGGLVFTLNLSAAREKFLLPKRKVSLEYRRDPANDLGRYIGKELRAAFGMVLPFSFIFEIAPDTGKLHVHGVVMPLDSSDAHLQALKRALGRAGGKIKGRGAARQVDLEPITDGFGWAAYTMKAFDEACRHLGNHNVAFISTDLVKLTQFDHAEHKPSKPSRPRKLAAHRGRRPSKAKAHQPPMRLDARTRGLVDEIVSLCRAQFNDKSVFT